MVRFVVLLVLCVLLQKLYAQQSHGAESEFGVLSGSDCVAVADMVRSYGFTESKPHEASICYGAGMDESNAGVGNVLLQSDDGDDVSNLGESVFSLYRARNSRKVTFLDEYKSDFARNVFWEADFGKSRLVMNGAKGFSDFFLSKSMGKQFDFVSPLMYRKCTFAYSADVKWATLGAGFDVRSRAFHFFLVSL